MIQRLSLALLVLLSLAIPFEHKYDKLFRNVSKALIPNNFTFPSFFNPKIYFYASDFIALFLLSLLLFSQPIRKWLFFPPTLFLSLLFPFAILSLILSPLSHYPLLYIRLLQLLTPILLFAFIASFFDSKEKEKITRWILGALLIAGCIEATIGLLQYIEQAPLGLRLIGEPKIMSTFQSPPDGTKWIFDTPFLHTPFSILRVAATLPHSNVLGGFLAASLLISSFFFIYSPKSRPLLFAAIPLQFFTLMLTYSRSALFGFLVAMTFWFAYAFFYKLQIQRKVLLTLFSLLFISASASTLILHKQILYRGGVFNYANSPASGSDKTRLEYQQKALDQIKESPLFGSGFGQISFQEKRPASVHNIYLYIATEMGIPALLAFLLFIATLLYAALKTAPTPYLQTLLSLFILFLFIGCCDFYPILFQQGKLLFFLCAALLGLHSRQEKGESSLTVGE
ncbi:MAG TPA: O-antigen ligase family protein [Chlamydiales bacterium]|nr:O-antigen ligase family protein [Chlamydiales bacterium]